MAIQAKASLLNTKSAAKLRAAEDNFKLAQTNYKNSNTELHEALTLFQLKEKAKKITEEKLQNTTKQLILAET